MAEPCLRALPARHTRSSSSCAALPEPNGGTQQTACVACDVDGDGRSDIIIAERTRAPAIVWLRPTARGWVKHVVEDRLQHPEAGGLAYDVDGDGHPDLTIGGDASSDELWWYENPAPDFDPERPWKRHLIKRGGGKAHHDQAVGDFKGTGRPQLAFWNQGAHKLFIADIPDDPANAGPWPCVEVFDYAHLRGAMKQEGMCACDLDGDGKTDLLAGQFWFRHRGGNAFEAIQISDRPGRVRAGHLMPGPVPQVVYSSGDGDGPLRLYACQGDPRDPRAWVPRALLDHDVLSGHTLEVADINGDGRLDIVTKPYTWDTPRIDVWLNRGMARSP